MNGAGGWNDPCGSFQPVADGFVNSAVTGWIVIQQQNSYQIIIYQIWKRQLNSWMAIQWQFYLQIAIRLFDQLYPNLTNGNSVTVLLPNCHLAFHTQIEMQWNPEMFQKHLFQMAAVKEFYNLHHCRGVDVGEIPWGGVQIHWAVNKV